MKKAYLFLMVFIASGFSAQAQSRSVNGNSMSLGISLGLLAGEGEEIVYRGAGSKNKVSQLLWPFKPLVYAGLDIHRNWRIAETRLGIFADAAFKFGFPGKTGQMEDKDWTHPEYPDFLTHYSVHEGKTEGAVLTDIDTGVSFTLFEKYLLKTFVSYSCMYFSWKAGRGSFLYPDSNGGHFYMTTSMNVGTYKQTWNIISPGISFYGTFNNYFDMEIFLKLSPFIWISATDEHLLRNLVVTENLYGGFFIEPGLLFSFTPNDLITLSLSFSYRNISGIRGDSKYDYSSEGVDVTAKDIGGAGLSTFDTGIVVKFKVLQEEYWW
jgi:outer membrane protease